MLSRECMKVVRSESICRDSKWPTAWVTQGQVWEKDTMRTAYILGKGRNLGWVQQPGTIWLTPFDTLENSFRVWMHSVQAHPRVQRAPADHSIHSSLEALAPGLVIIPPTFSKSCHPAVLVFKWNFLFSLLLWISPDKSHTSKSSQITSHTPKPPT
jgi:hypothetical protein